MERSVYTVTLTFTFIGFDDFTTETTTMEITTVTGIIHLYECMQSNVTNMCSDKSIIEYHHFWFVKLATNHKFAGL